jgi:tripartite-type tricarboxylate transporter receptor subunit TctC
VKHSNRPKENSVNTLRNLAGALAVTLAAATPALAAWPEKPVRVVVTTVPGPLDAFARAVVGRMQERLKQPFVIDNKPGAGGNVGADMVTKAAPDGYTLLFALDTTFTVNPSLYAQMPFDPAKDLAIVGVPVTYGQMLAVNPHVAANSLPDLIKLAKAQKLSYASGGNGSPSHLTMAAFLATAGVDMVHIPYKGTGASVIDVMGGQVESVFAVTSGIWPQVKAGKLKALAVSSEKRSVTAPDVPTVAEQGYPSFNASFAYVLAAPANTPPEILQTLARELAAAMQSKEVMDLDKLADYTPTNLNPQASAAWLAETRKHWADVISKSKIKAD